MEAMRCLVSAVAAIQLAACAANICAEGETGDICTVVGTGEAGFAGDGGPALEATLFHPIDVELDGQGRVWVLDWSNHHIRRVENDVLEAVVGTGWPGDGTVEGGEDAPAGVSGERVSLNHPTDLVFDPVTGEGLLAAWHNHKVRWIDPATDRVGILVGGDPGYSGDGGPPEDALLDYPHSLVSDGETLWILDNGNRRLRRVAADIIDTVAGNGGLAFDGDGPGLEVALGVPDGGGEGFQPGGRVRLDEEGAVLLAEPLHGRIRRFDPETGELATLVGGDDGVVLAYPNDVFARDGFLFVVDRDDHAVLKIDLDDYDVETIAGGLGPGYSGDGGPASEAHLNQPAGFAFDEHGSIWIADYGNHVVRRVM
jgi:DNA-binding beta-propeller fold protein YncE